MKLPNWQLKLAIATAIVDKIKLEDLVSRLWREDPDEVRSVYQAIRDNMFSERCHMNSHYRRRENRRKRKLETRHREGVPLREIAKRHGIDYATFVSLLEHHGIVELVQFGLDQKRRRITHAAFKAKLGHNVNSTCHIGHLEGYAKSSPFIVLYEERLADILWMLDYPGIVQGIHERSTKKLKLKWLLETHPYLPDAEIAKLAGYARYRVSVARKRLPHPEPPAHRSLEAA